MTWLYFNEIDPFTAQWCRNAWPQAEVDDRSIRDITRPVDAVRQHYFAGLGGWEYACELAGWPDDWPLWTGSCPCQPFSVAGKGQAHEDKRDLWPAFFRLIALGTPPVIIGEQVNGAIAFGWLDRICDDLEGIGYAVGATVLPASGVGAPHIRQRLYWVAIRLGNSDPSGLQARDAFRVRTETRSECVAQPSSSGGLGDSRCGTTERRRVVRDVRDSTADQQSEAHQREWHGNAHSDTGEAGGVAVADVERAFGAGRAQFESVSGREAIGLAVSAGSRHQQTGQHDGGSSLLSPRLEQRSGDGGLEHAALDGRRQGRSEPDGQYADPARDAGGLGDSARGRRRQRQSENESQGRGWSGPSGTDADSAGGLEHAERASTARYGSVGGHGLHGAEPELVGPRGAWDESKLIYCRDGKFRRIATQPGLQPLADSGRFGNPRTDPDLSSRIGALRAAGNAIVIPLAAEFIRAVMDIVLDKR